MLAVLHLGDHLPNLAAVACARSIDALKIIKRWWMPIPGGSPERRIFRKCCHDIKSTSPARLHLFFEDVVPRRAVQSGLIGFGNQRSAYVELGALSTLRAQRAADALPRRDLLAPLPKALQAAAEFTPEHGSFDTRTGSRRHQRRQSGLRFTAGKAQRRVFRRRHGGCWHTQSRKYRLRLRSFVVNWKICRCSRVIGTVDSLGSLAAVRRRFVERAKSHLRNCCSVASIPKTRTPF